MKPESEWTPLQRQVAEALTKYGSKNKAAEVLGISRSAVDSRCKTMGAKVSDFTKRRAGDNRRAEMAAQVEAAPVPDPSPFTPKEVHDAAFWRRKCAAAEKQVAELEHLAEKLSGIRGVPYHVPPYVAPRKSEWRGQSVIGCHWSDVHMGEVIAAEEVQGINEFNSDICRQRLRRYVDAACAIGPRWAEDTDCVGLYFALGGDLVSGDINDELRMTNDLTAHEQVQAMVEEVSLAIRQFAEVFGHVHVSCVPGNHGRNTPKSTAKLYSRLSYDMLIGAMVQREFQDNPRITFQMSEAKDQVTPIFGRMLLNTHGDKMGTGGGQGFAGPFLPIIRGAKKVQAQYASRGIKLDYILHGHYHISGNPGNVLSNGSVPGYSEYADDLRVVVEPPQQNLFLMHSKWGMRERMPIQLTDPVEPQKPRVRVQAWSG